MKNDVTLRYKTVLSFSSSSTSSCKENCSLKSVHQENFACGLRIISVLEEAGIAHETHLFVEGENAPATDVAAVIRKVYEEVKGDLLVASRSNKVYCKSL